MKELWSKIIAVLGKVPQDKLLHFIAGMLITALFAVIKTVAPYALFFGMLAGVLKEWWDNGNDGSVEWKDILTTCLGALLMQIFIWLYFLIW